MHLVGVPTGFDFQAMATARAQAANWTENNQAYLHYGPGARAPYARAHEA